MRWPLTLRSGDTQWASCDEGFLNRDWLQHTSFVVLSADRLTWNSWRGIHTKSPSCMLRFHFVLKENYIYAEYMIMWYAWLWTQSRALEGFDQKFIIYSVLAIMWFQTWLTVFCETEREIFWIIFWSIFFFFFLITMNSLKLSIY